MSKPIENSKQLPIAWVYPEFMKNIKDAKCWTAYATYHEERPIPLFIHLPTEESSLTDEKIMNCWENEVNKWQEIENYDIYNFARAIIKASRGEK